MSIKVGLGELGPAMAKHDFAYLLSPGRERPHVVAVVPRLIDGVLVIDSPGRSAATLAAEHPAVTLVFPPRRAGGYSLIVDGEATVAGGDGEATVAGGDGEASVAGGDGGDPAGGAHQPLSVRPGHAVLHRPAPGTSAPSPDGGEEGREPPDLQV